MADDIRVTGRGSVAALRKLEIEVPARGRVSPRPLVLSLVPALDAVALIAAAGVSGGDPFFVTAALLTFLVLNVDTSRAYRLDPRVGHEMGWLLGRLGVPLLVLAWLASADLLPWVGPVRDLDRLVVAGSLGALMVLVGRAVAYAISRAAKARRIIAERALVVGTGPVGLEIAMALERHPEYGLDPIGFIDGPTGEELPYPLLGGPHDLERVVEEFEVHRIVVAFGRGRTATWPPCSGAWRRSGSRSISCRGSSSSARSRTAPPTISAASRSSTSAAPRSERSRAPRSARSTSPSRRSSCSCCRRSCSLRPWP
jgi:hypothetical protein